MANAITDIKRNWLHLLNKLKNDNRESDYFVLNVAMLLWLASICVFLLKFLYCLFFGGVITLFLFVFYCASNHGMDMFKKNKSLNDIQSDNTPNESIEDSNKSTIIAKDMWLEGNISSSGHVHVYGEVLGDIITNDGFIKIMSTGIVIGNVSCRNVMIDGRLDGVCKAEMIEICEHGLVTGKISYTEISVKKGGCFTGSSEINSSVDKRNSADSKSKDLELKFKNKSLSKEVVI